jgi:hypothetical protein
VGKTSAKKSMGNVKKAPSSTSLSATDNHQEGMCSHVHTIVVLQTSYHGCRS